MAGEARSERDSMLETTIAGSLPKPSWLAEPEALWAAWRPEAGDALDEAKRDATRLVLMEQEDAGIDIVTEGEQSRQHFVHGFLETISGLDFVNRKRIGIRADRYEADCPRVIGPVARTRPVHGGEARFARAHTTRKLKFTLPGPMTIVDTVAGSLLGGMTFALPTFNGTGLVGLFMDAIGVDDDLLDFLGAYATLGPSTGGESSGCDGCGDEGSSGCADCEDSEALGCAGCDEGGCSVEDSIQESGCSGEPTTTPEGGCQGCGVALSSGSTARWRIRVTSEGLQVAPIVRRIRLNHPQALMGLIPVLWVLRRRRSSWERP